MRKDMKDLLVNTGRRAGGGKASSYRARLKRADDESLPQRLSTARHRQFGYDCKELGDRLRPLYRFLVTNCGRDWGEVYSEIKEVADHRSVRGYHLMTHVENYVVPNNYDVGHDRRYGPFFVDADGTLQKERKPTAEEYRLRRVLWKREEGINPRIADTADHWWEKIEGLWYEFTIVHTKSNYPVEWLIDRGNNVVDIGRILKETTQHETKKRQVGSKDIKKLEALLKKAA